MKNQALLRKGFKQTYINNDLQGQQRLLASIDRSDIMKCFIYVLDAVKIHSRIKCCALNRDGYLVDINELGKICSDSNFNDQDMSFVIRR